MNETAAFQVEYSRTSGGYFLDIRSTTSIWRGRRSAQR